MSLSTIYLAYARSDLRFASRLAMDLMSLGFSVWIEQDENVQSGPEQRKREQTEGIANAEAFILTLSPTAMVSPDLFEQLAYAIEQRRRVIVAERQRTQLTPAVARQLADVPRFDFSRLHYTESLSELVALCGGDPSLVNSVAGGEMDSESNDWLPGEWQAIFNNAETGVDGVAQWRFSADGQAVGRIMTQQQAIDIELHVVGTWRFLDDRLSIQGQSRMTMSIEDVVLPEQMSYMLSLKVVEQGRDRFNAVSAIGDRVIFQRMAG